MDSMDNKKLDRKLVITHDVFIVDWRLNRVANYDITESKIIASLAIIQPRAF